MIKKISLRNFRNHETLELDIFKSLVYITGKNGAGKTSILESIYFAATSKTYRSSDEKEMIMKNKEFAHVKLNTEEDSYELILSKTGKRAFKNKVEIRKISEYIGNLFVILFAPEDLSLVKGSPSERRQFIDLELLQINKSYLITLNEYKKILKQRNALLKRITVQDDNLFLNIISENLYENGVKIMEHRREFIEALNIETKLVFKKFSNNELEISYKSDCDNNSFHESLFKKQKLDILYDMTLNGPHKDDIVFELNKRNAKSFASQGEQRLIVLSLKLGLMNLIEKMTNKKTILLLDDVLSELDQEKQDLFLNELPKQNMIIMTSVNEIIDNKDIQIIKINKEKLNEQ